MPKIRADALFFKLTPEQRELLFEWLIIEGISLKDARAKVQKEFGIETSLSALSSYYSRHGFSWRVEQAKAAAEAEGATLPKNIDELIRRRMKQRRFELSIGKLTLTELKALALMDGEERKLRLKETIEPAKLAIAERRVAVLERKFQESENTLKDTTLSPEQKEKKMREILGMTA